MADALLIRQARAAALALPDGYQFFTKTAEDPAIPVAP